MRLFFAATCLAIAGCATPIPSYMGTDAGYVVLGLGAATSTVYNNYWLKICPVPDDGVRKIPDLEWKQIADFSKPRVDYQDQMEQGVVLSEPLAPGKYAFCNFHVFYNGGTTQVQFSSREPFSIPFEIKPQEATYLGNYQANKIEGRNMFGMKLPQGGGVIFAVEGRMDADLAIARKIRPELPQAVSDATPVPATIANPFFVEARDAAR